MKTLLAIIMLTTSISAATLTLNWTDNSDNENGFKVERAIEDSSFVQIATVAEDITTYKDEDIEIDIKYSYRVRAFNLHGNSGYTNTATHKVVDPKYFEPFESHEDPLGLSTSQLTTGNSVAISTEK